MRVTSVSVIANESEAIRFDLRNVESKSPYQVRTIIGLDADELIPKFYGFSRDGSKKFFDFSLKPRTIVMRIVLSPRFHLGESYSYIRDNLYRTISATRSGEIELQFHAGASTVARINGFITKFEVPYFSKTPELQLTVRCNDPFFRSINPTIMEASDLGYSNPVVVADSASTAPHGLHMHVTMTAAIPSFTIQDRQTDPEWMFKVLPFGGFQVGDVLHLSSEFTNKQLYYVRGGVTTHLMDKIELTSVWPTVFPGFNEFWFPDMGSFTWGDLEYITTYWGV